MVFKTLEIIKIDDEKQIQYFKYHWCGIDNAIIYTAESVSNANKMIANGEIWIFNQFQ